MVDKEKVNYINLMKIYDLMENHISISIEAANQE